MNSELTKQISVYGLLTVLSLIIIFHLLVITGIIPYTIVWGGRLKTDTEMYVFETTSILLNLVMLTIVSLYAGLINLRISKTFLRVSLWLMFALFLLNTLGNLNAINELEKLLFTPLTLLLSLFSFRLALSKG